MGHTFISDIAIGKVFKVRASHYPAHVTAEIDSLTCPVGIAVSDDVLSCVDAKGFSIVLKNLNGETVVEVDKLDVKQPKKRQQTVDAWHENDM